MKGTKNPKFLRKPESRIEDLVQAALEVFSTNGYRASRLEDVAQAAGVTKGTVYHYFHDKEELLAYAIASSLKPALDEAESHTLADRASIREVLETTLDEAWRRWTDPRFSRLYRLITGEIASSHPLIFKEWFAGGPLRTWKLWEGILEAGKRTGEFRAEIDAKTASRLMLASLTSLAIFESLIPKSSPEYCNPDDLFASTKAFLISSLVNPPRGQMGDPG